MEKIFRLLSAWVLFFGLGGPFADVNLSGTLVNEQRLPIAVSCTCVLEKINLGSVSDPASGAFSLQGVTGNLNGRLQPTPSPAFMHGRALYFNSTSESEPVIIEIFSVLRERESLVLSKKLPVGKYAIDPLEYLGPGAASGVRFARVRNGAGATTVKLPFAIGRPNLGNRGLTLIAAGTNAIGSVLKKPSATLAGAVDTLVTTCGIYPEVRIPVPSYSGDLGLITIPTRTTGGKVVNDPATKTVTLSDDKNRIRLRLSYDGKCLLDDVRIRGSQNLVSTASGVAAAIKVSGNWYTTRSRIPTPTVAVNGNVVTIGNIQYGGGGVNVVEKWTFTTHPDCISWSIGRKYLSAGTLEDTYFPGWVFNSMNTWDGALCNNGAVAWNKFLETELASLGQHTSGVTLWNRQSNTGLRVVADTGNGKNFAYQFSHHPGGLFSVNQSITSQELKPKYNLSRYLSNKLDVWQAFNVGAGDSIGVNLDLWPLAYDSAYDRGTFVGVNGGTIREMLHTIARYGVIDKKHFGGNGWRSGYICLQEQWWPQIALALNEPDYTDGLKESYDYYRDRAVGADGRVKPRFKDTPGDNMPGTYDTAGFYEVRWGYAMNVQPDYVMVVAEHFQNTGDLAWAQGQKATCEKVLGYLLNRDSNGNGLFEMMSDSHTEGKSSDWIDIIWASFENALVNAEMYSALTQWADVEDILGDKARAASYRAAALKLKTAFNKPIDQGGFWNPKTKWYVHWRDKDNSIHGDNLVMPVNIGAIAYGICDDTARISAILSQMETKMQAEKLFFWPLTFNSYAPGEGAGQQWPFPNYENGDIFLSWGELAVRAYAKYNPAIAMKYVKNVLNRYEQDGLGFQRYLRTNQVGTGDDILSGNCMAITGLYRDIYGVRPLYNGLYLEPHLTTELNGTRLKYWLRNRLFTIDLSVDNYAVTVNGVTVRDTKPFAIDDNGNRL